MTYRIRTVSELTGIPRNTLIAWERRYGVIRPVRHPNGYRSYTEEDVAQLLRIKNAQKAGLKISEAFALLEHGEVQAGPPLATALAAPPRLTTSDMAGVRRGLLDALLHYQKDRADELLQSLIHVPFPTRVQDVYFPVLAEIGDRWASGEVSIAQEHYASSILRNHLASLLLNIGPASSKATHAACTTFPGDLHEIPALALAIQLSISGFRVSYLGPNLPTDELCAFVAGQRPMLVCVSVINSVTEPQVREYAEQVTRGLSPAGKLVLGGRSLASLSLPSMDKLHVRTDWWTGVEL